MITKINIGNVIPIYRIRIGHVVIYCKGNIYFKKRYRRKQRETYGETVLWTTQRSRFYGSAIISKINVGDINPIYMIWYAYTLNIENRIYIQHFHLHIFVSFVNLYFSRSSIPHRGINMFSNKSSFNYCSYWFPGWICSYCEYHYRKSMYFHCIWYLMCFSAVDI
jgi:hypothetical protein